ncbi:hypothetical protein ABW21_db0204912 [Orbilia brochopaga]|nr:hypothetical protein ABW21_db0204912 [Drechslerella brochopaga]
MSDSRWDAGDSTDRASGFLTESPRRKPKQRNGAEIDTRKRRIIRYREARIDCRRGTLSDKTPSAPSPSAATPLEIERDVRNARAVRADGNRAARTFVGICTRNAWESEWCSGRPSSVAGAVVVVTAVVGHVDEFVQLGGCEGLILNRRCWPRGLAAYRGRMVVVL